MKNKRRPQAQKPRNQKFNQAMMEKGRSSATEPHINRARYSRTARRDRSWLKED